VNTKMEMMCVGPLTGEVEVEVEDRHNDASRLTKVMKNLGRGGRGTVQVLEY
jgi:hypothetical protein